MLQHRVRSSWSPLFFSLSIQLVFKTSLICFTKMKQYFWKHKNEVFLLNCHMAQSQSLQFKNEMEYISNRAGVFEQRRKFIQHHFSPRPQPRSSGLESFYGKESELLSKTWVMLGALKNKYLSEIIRCQQHGV